MWRKINKSKLNLVKFYGVQISDNAILELSNRLTVLCTKTEKYKVLSPYEGAPGN